MEQGGRLGGSRVAADEPVEEAGPVEDVATLLRLAQVDHALNVELADAAPGCKQISRTIRHCSYDLDSQIGMQRRAAAGTSESAQRDLPIASERR